MQLVLGIKLMLIKHGAWKKGIIRRLAARAGVGPRQITRLLNNQLKELPMDSLAKICKYMVDDLHMDPQEVAANLFRLEPNSLWSMLGDKRVDYCVGLRNMRQTSEPIWVNANDNMLQAAFQQEMFAIGPPQFSNLHLHQVPAYRAGCDEAQFVEQTLRHYGRLIAGQCGHALVCLGSVKSIPTSECVIAAAFGLVPFSPQDRVELPRHRGCPVFLRVRDDDPPVPATHAGRRLARVWIDFGPGIYYEIDSGEWGFCPSDDLHDAALVFYVYDPTREAAQLVLAGFSGIASGCLGRDLASLSPRLWPPSLSTPQLKVGAFIIRYEFQQPAAPANEAGPLLPEVKHTEVIRISETVLARKILGEERQAA